MSIPPRNPNAVAEQIMLPSKKGGFREVWQPNAETLEFQQELLRVLYGMNIPLPYAYGGVPQKSLLKHIQPHKNNDVFYMVDIKDAFGSVDKEKLVETVLDICEEFASDSSEKDYVAGLLDNYTFLPAVPGLPQGFPASPLLFNLYCRQMDQDLAHTMSELQYRDAEYNPKTAYTRWIDDLTFSVNGDVANDPGLNKRYRKYLRSVIATYGFEIAHHKSRFHELRNGPVTITGLSLYPDADQHNFPPSYQEETRRTRLKGRRIAPSPQLLQAVHEALEDIASKIVDETVTQLDIDTVHGYNGVLNMGTDPEHHKSEAVRSLHSRYKRIVASIALNN